MVGNMQAPNSQEFEFLFVTVLMVPMPTEANCFSMLYRARPPLAGLPAPYRRGGYFCF